MARSNLERHTHVARERRTPGALQEMVGDRRQRPEQEMRLLGRQEEGLGERVELGQCGRRFRRLGRRFGSLILRRLFRIHLEGSTSLQRSSKHILLISFFHFYYSQLSAISISPLKNLLSSSSKYI